MNYDEKRPISLIPPLAKVNISVPWKIPKNKEEVRLNRSTHSQVVRETDE